MVAGNIGLVDSQIPIPVIKIVLMELIHSKMFWSWFFVCLGRHSVVAQHTVHNKKSIPNRGISVVMAHHSLRVCVNMAFYPPPQQSF